MTTNLSSIENPSDLFEQLTGARPGKSDKRKAERVPYEIVIRAAPYDGAQMPASDQFQEMATRDLSPTGISFYSPHEPTCEQMVLQLGDSTAPVYLTARVVRYQQGYYLRKRQYFVGCAFTGRLTPKP